MALTRPRYSQIPDSDYKNSCRIVTTTNVTLTSGAPLTYDGVTLVQYDRVLVAGQTDKTQNGIYSVTTLGSGSNGSWVRSKDANANDRLTAGMNTFVEEGTYSGQFWHLLTPGPIVLGVTELIFGQISGNAAGISSQVQYNFEGSIAGAANLRYDAATGNVVIGGGTASTSNVTGALTVNGGLGVTGEIWAQSNIYSAGSRVLTAYDLQTITFTANYISKDPANVAVPVVGTGTIYGTHNFGNLEAISTYGDYNTTAQSGYYSVNDASGAPGFVVYVGFTGITSFNRAVYNINYTQLSGHTVTLDFYNYDTDLWDAFATYSGSGSWQSFALGVIDANPYIDAAGNVTTRIYHVSSGNTAHRTWIDYVALEQSITGGQGPRGATGPTGPSGTYSGGYIVGTITTGGNIFTSGNIVSNSGNISISTTTGAIVLTGDGGMGLGGNIFAGGNITANAFYTLNGLFWSSNGQAFSSGLEVSEINTANALSNISTQVTSLRFDRDTGFNVTELNPGNVKISLGSSFKTWHVPGQADLVAVAEDEVTFFGNGIDITTNPVYPKALTFIANNKVLEANIGSFYTYANANIGTLFLGNASTQANLGAYQLYANANAASQQIAIDNINANLGAFQTYANANIGTLFLGNISTQANLGAFQLFSNTNAASQQTAIDNINANLGAYQIYANANIGTLYLGNISTNANLGAFQTYANTTIGGILTEISSLYGYIDSNAGIQSANIASINANIGAFQAYANTKIGTNNNSNLVVASTTESVSAITGAVVVAGGVGIGGNLYVAGNIFASNLVAINSTTLTVQDPLLYLNASDPFPYNYDIGFYSHFVDGVGPHYQHTGVVRDYSTGIWGFFSNVATEPGTTIDWSNVDIIYDTVRVGDLVVSNTTPSTSTTTGALRVAGGVGIQGNLYITNTGDVSANIGSLTSTVDELAGVLGSYKSYANIYLGVSKTFTVTNVTSSEYIIDGIAGNPGLYLIRGQKYNFSVDASSHVFWIKTAPTTGTGDQYSDGVFDNGTDHGLIVFDVPLSAPDVLYYASEYDATMNGQLNIVDFGDINANLSAFQTYANTTFTTYSNANVTAYLPIHTGNISAGNVNVTRKVSAEKIYTTDGVYWSGNGVAFINGSTYTADTAPPVSGNIKGDQWYNTVTDVLFEYLDNGVSQYWVDVQTMVIAANAVVTIPELIQANLGAFQAYANTKIGTNTNSNLVIAATTTSTNTTTGALVVGGGVGVGGNIYVTGEVSTPEIRSAGGTSHLYMTDIGLVSLAVAGQEYKFGASGIEASPGIFGGSYGGNKLSLNNETALISNRYDTVTIQTGTDGSAQNTWTFGNSALTAPGRITASGNIVAAATTISTTTTTGALVVAGGAGIAGNTYIGANLVVTQSGLFQGPYNEYSLLSGVFVGNTGTGVPSPRVGFFNGNTQQNWQIDNFGGTFRWFVPGSSKMTLYDSGNLNITGGYTVGGKKAVNGPAFRAYITTGQTISSTGSQIKVTFGGETFDTDGCFASSTFTPTVEGYYQLNATVRIAGPAGTGENILILYKNGTEYARGTNGSGTEIGNNFYSMQVSDIVYANGTSDTFEVYIQQGSGSNKDTTAGQNISYFSGCMIRGA